MKINRLFKFKRTFTLGFFALAFFIFGLGFGKEASAATYTVCSSGCNYIAIQSALDAVAFTGGDILEIQADTPGGSKIYTESILVADSGTSTENKFTIQGRVGDSVTITSSGNYTITNVFGTNYVKYKNIAVTGGLVASFRLRASVSPEFIDITLTNSNVNGIGLYVDAAVTGLVATRLRCNNNAGKGAFLNSPVTGTIIDSQFNNNGSYGAEGNLGGIQWIGTRDSETGLSSLQFNNNQSHGWWNDVPTSIAGSIVNADALDNYNTIEAKYRHGFTITNVASNFTFAGNHGRGDVGLDLQASAGTVSNNIFYNNIFEGIGLGQAGENWSGILMAASDSSYTLVDNIFYNNIILSSSPAGASSVSSALFVGRYSNLSNVFKNNVIYNTSNGYVILRSNAIETPYFAQDYSLFYSSSIASFNSSNTNIDLLDWKIQSQGDTNSKFENPLFISASNFNFQYSSPAIDSGTSVGLTSDYAGNPIYGTPDIGAYEYQPPHVIGTDKIDIGAGARIYGDGKFRDKEITNSSLADLTITPEGGNFNSYNANEVRPEWMDIKNITWEDTKEWTESSPNSSLTNTLHEVGDLTPNKYYNVSVDNVLGQNVTGTNCTNGICKADSNGKIAFTYTGTYSEHTFKVEAGDNANPTLTNNTSNKFSVETTSVNLSLTTDENSTCRYSNNSTTTFDNATPFTTTGETSHSSELTNLTSGDYTYYAICQDNNSNESTYTLTFEIAPQELKEKVSLPIIKTSEGKEKMKSSTIYSDEKEIKLQGEDIKLTNGTIKIYQNSKKIKTISANEQGKWNGKVKLKSDFSGYLKVKQYNQYGTLISEKKTKVKVDNEKPEFTSFPKNQTLVTRGKTNLTFLAEDNNKVTEYKIYLGGNIYKTKSNSFTIPAKTNLGLQYLRIRAYDKAGNSSYKETFVLIK